MEDRPSGLAHAQVWLDSQGLTEAHRLARQVELADGFWLSFLFTPSTETAELLRKRLEDQLTSRGSALLVHDPPSPDDLVASLQWLASDATLAVPYIWLQAIRPVSHHTKIGRAWAAAWETFLLRLNERRDALKRHAGGGVILVAPPAIKPMARDAAPDLWSIRSLVMDAPAPERAHGTGATVLPVKPAPTRPLDPTTTPVETEDNVHALTRAVAKLASDGHYVEAIPLAERALELTERIVGRAHPQTASSLNNLANLLCYAQEFDSARPLYERALTIQEKALGPDHPDTSMTRSNLGVLHSATGDQDGARPLFERALAGLNTVRGADDPDTATVLLHLANLLTSGGEYAEAVPLVERALVIMEHALGLGHPRTQAAAESLASLRDREED